jgi:rSAM/selenodomain-associated transferase 1
MESTVLLLFIRYPEPGRVKTRLAAKIGPDEAAEVYRNFILDILATLERCGLPLKIYFSPSEREAAFPDWLGPGYVFRPQKGTDLGARMRIAFEEAFDDGFASGILLGSDVPDLPLYVLKEAVDALRSSDAVIGPAQDGGYYLIGFRRNAFPPDVFNDIPWGTTVVLRETTARLEAHGCRIHLLPEWQDVDTVEDLAALSKRAQNTDFSGSKTVAYMKGARRKA